MSVLMYNCFDVHLFPCTTLFKGHKRGSSVLITFFTKCLLKTEEKNDLFSGTTWPALSLRSLINFLIGSSVSMFLLLQ